MPRRVSALLLSIAGAMCLAATARASHYVVAQDGSAECASIQDAFDRQSWRFRDSILVMPGTYLEDIVLPSGYPPMWLIGVEGAGTTTVGGIQVSASYSAKPVRMEGLSFGGPAVIFGGDLRSYFHRCAFRGSVYADGETGKSSNLEDCDFYARVTIFGYVSSNRSGAAPPFRRLRFHSAPLTVRNDDTGTNTFKECTFEGPADTLLIAIGGVDDVALVDCLFRNAGIGVVHVVPWMYARSVTRCRFADLTTAGIALQPGGYSTGIDVVDSRFERCGTAIRWVPMNHDGSEGVRLVRDTILAASGNGAEIGRGIDRIDSVVVANCGGHGVAMPFSATTPNAFPGWLSATASRFENNGGSGLVLEDTTHWMPGGYPAPNVVTACTFSGNRGDGLGIAAPQWDVRRCRSSGNGGAGFRGRSVSGLGARRIESNTSVLNGEEGFLVVASQPSDPRHSVRHNLSVLNFGAGFRMPHASSGSFAHNNSWGNYLAAYVGAWGSADSNLTVDPRFCDLAAGDLGLMQGSPCGAGGVYGLIGALPESCPDLVAVEPVAGAGVAFSVRPSVARGSVEFVVPSGAGEARVEVYDVGGRTVWRTTVGAAGGAVRWQGERAGGRARAGLYWARCTRGSDAATRRLVWLE